MLASLAGVRLTHVPYRGAGPALTDLLGGQVDMMFATAAAASGYVGSGKLRALGVTTAKPSARFKGVPAIADTVPGYRVESWYGLYVPAGTPAAVVDRLNAAAAKAARSPEFSHKLESEGLVISAGPPAELDDYVHGEERRWARIVKDNGIKAE
jgi:tripartite-type tricarboxylate transporter receptor subunit TctC